MKYMYIDTCFLDSKNCLVCHGLIIRINIRTVLLVTPIQLRTPFTFPSNINFICCSYLTNTRLWFGTFAMPT